MMSLLWNISKKLFSLKTDDTLYLGHGRKMKEDEPELHMNRELATGRLKSTVNRMKNKPEMIRKYAAVIEDQYDKEIIEKVEVNSSDGLMHYLPHHAVVTPKKKHYEITCRLRCFCENKKGK
ncbi:hypothetical protein DPMN_035080 [Dreissena polymorpha]|uniref:Uncharacterized protein n=1 Tax=Dreissena polymorpha TaxID=45954 RepID=A0A9D4M6V4_DREPO|nr:hypothetical protein DPMN_035080 [Dreissena polymorpha]